MPPNRNDVQSMVVALFTLIAGVERARRERKAAAALDLLQVIAAGGEMRPSEIAGQRSVHRSLVTRQLRELEDAGYVLFAGDPDDGRAWRVALTPAGREEMRRLQEVGLARFAKFVADWEPAEVQQLAALLAKLTSSMAVVTGQENEAAPADGAGPPGRRRHAGARDRAGRS
jgi:DNA-binding MarR family transcriptional regulator